jgi:hypothetical protein
VEFKFDTITPTQVIGLERTTLKPIKLDRNKVVSINFQTDQKPKLGAGSEGVVLTDGSVIKGHIAGIDETNIVVRTAGGKEETIDRSKLAIIELSTIPKGEGGGQGTGEPIVEKQVIIPATEPWTDTGIDVRQGDHISVEAPANGFISCGPQAGTVNPDGANPLVVDPRRPVPDVKACALLGRVGTSAFRIGLVQTPIEVQQAGRLLLGINDYEFRDNSGQWGVIVKVTR